MTCSTCKHFGVADIRGPVCITICKVVENGEMMYRDETQTCEKWEATDEVKKVS